MSPSRTARLSKRDEPLVPIDGGRLRKAIEYWKWPRRDLAKAVTRPGHPVHAPTLDAICAGTQHQCRASLRRALAEELGVLEGWLASATDYPGLTLENMLQDRHAQGRDLWKVPRAWHALVESLDLDPAVRAALIDLPTAIGQASIAMGLITVDKTGLHMDRRVRRAGLRELEGWYEWLHTLVEVDGPKRVKKALTGALPDLQTRFVHANRYLRAP